ncbi:acetoacetate decarboxylase [Amycolatopsis acidiphila]|uniref:Acetoacetate decarboxylase n=1 Tax=Amycolatopsis acidiphila TaxID=715473 RepID=A0A557ZQ63_9PSEU|nr:acetoacetate decarboxylase [Amycolatopsis acidiphila]TVT14165.1 acetoacetate decarboxylase [Amycolatopsis acidiphila]UIJ59231.1 acetoacetate decarboxylase [Amycolatopsis acidiphila]GHG79266.1 acetoacetate decarboxylase [Amycolatopsis acidiphila]
MKAEDVRRRLSTPLTGPAFPPMSPRFTDREYLNIVYRTDPEALRAVVPEPLEIGEPLVRFEVMRMGDVTGYGPYTEAGQAIPVSFEGERGEYLHAMYLDNFAATASGREVSAYPKTTGSPRLYVDHGALVGTLDYGSLRVATATMGYQHRALDLDEARAQITVPTFMLKIVPGYTGRPRVSELVRTEITDVTVKQAWTGPARLQLFEHVLAPLADLPVRQIVSASHILTDLTLAPVRPVHDYLKETS